MTYDVHNLSPEALTKIKLVLKHIKVQIEIQGVPDHETVEVHWEKGIEGVEWNEYRDIVAQLIKDKTIVAVRGEPRTTYGLLQTCIKAIDVYIDHIDDLLKKPGKLENTMNDREHGTSFISKTSTLYVQGQSVKIAERKKETIAHTILDYVFNKAKRKLDDQHFYADIAFEAFGDDKYNNEFGWKTYHSACKQINEKVRLATPSGIADFLELGTGKTAYVRVNSKYL